MKAVLVHYGEIALKGKNRRFFEKALVDNIKISIGKNLVKEVKRLEGRLFVSLNKDDKKTTDIVRTKLSNIFGIKWFSFPLVCKTDLDEIKKTVSKASKGKMEDKTFKIDTRRSFKRFPHNSIQMNEMLGGVILDEHKCKVSLDNPDVTVSVEITKDYTFVSIDKIRGPGGLPIGSGGRMLVLLSGGIDSCAAAWLIMKRGFSVDYLHIHALRNDSDVKKTKIKEIYEKMKEYNPRSKLYTASYHEFDIKSQSAPSDYNLILFRRFMFKLAEKFAEKIKAKAIVAGDNIAQVASQTIESITVSDEAVNIPIMRPLLTYDKEEIIDLARKIGTFDLSIKDYKDCCSIISSHPTTKPKLEKVQLYEKKIGIDKIVNKSIKNVSILD